MNDNVSIHFDKLLLSLLFCTVLLIAVVIIFYHGADAATSQWIEGIVGQILAALLTLMVGNRMAQRSADKNGNGNGAAATPPQKS